LIGLADFAYPDPKVLIELDGRLGHSGESSVSPGDSCTNGPTR
jgi:hypothetical protein